MPTLEWIWKDKVVNHHQEVPFRILDKKYTFNAENSENMFITCTVVDDRKIEYHGEIMYMTTLAKMLTGKKTGIAGPIFFKYKGKNLQEYYNEFQVKHE